MKLVLIAIAFMYTFPCMAQKNDWEKESLKGKVKVSRWYEGDHSANTVELRTKSYDRSVYGVDSYSVTGVKVAKYQVISGIVNELSMDHETFKYDSTGNLITVQSYVVINGDTGMRIKYTYLSGQITTMEEFSSNGRLDEKTVYKYNDKGKVLEEIVYPNCGPPRIYKYTYTDSEVVILHFLGSSTNDGKTIKKYDERNNIVSRESYYANGTLMYRSTTEYVYDNQGNWIRRITENPRGGYDLVIREIEYY